MVFQDHVLRNSPHTPTTPVFTVNSIFSGSSSPTGVSPLSDATRLAHTLADINSLSITYPSVLKLKNDYDNTSTQLLQANQNFLSVMVELRALRDENRGLYAQLTELRGSSNASSLVSVLSQFQKPSKRPEGLPFEVLWCFDDALLDPDSKPSESNGSRPNPRECVRKADGTLLLDAEWVDLEKTVRAIYAANLQRYEGGARGRPATLSYLRTYQADALNLSIEELESTHPVVGLCSFNWKAFCLFRTRIQNKSRSIGRSVKKTSASPAAGLAPSSTAVPSTQAASESRAGPSESHPPLQPSAAAQPPPPSTPRPPLVSINQPDGASCNDVPNPVVLEKRKSPDGVAEEDGENSRPAEPPAKRVCADRVPNAESTFNTALAMPQRDLRGSQPLSGAITISHIRVEPSFENIQDALLNEFPAIKESTQLLERLTALAVLDVHAAPPSDNVVSFISRIENADPNTADPDDMDNTGANWGHYQFTAGSMTIRSVLTSWSDLGSTTIALRLLAAVIKTCRVARHICFQHSSPDQNLLAETYLDILVGHLWELVKNLETPTPSASGGSASATPPAEAEIKRLQVLQVSDLVKWISENGIDMASNKRTPKKAELISIILQSSSIPDDDYIANIITTRRRTKKSNP